MGNLHIACRSFAVLSGIRQDANDYAVCVQPKAGALQKKGALALLTEPSGDHPSLAGEACQVVQRGVVEHYFSDNSLSLTTSLLNALDSANGALLEYNYSLEEGQRDLKAVGSVAIQGGGVKTRRTRVGLTAVLLRPDGTGAYLTQMSPAQAYIRHAGMLNALPEPPSWRAPVSGRAIKLVKVPPPGEHEQSDEADEEDLDSENMPPPLASPAMGSGPGIEADLIYRRVEQGDMVVLVSSSLARLLDRPAAERLFTGSDAEEVVEALVEMATERGLAAAHACVLELGVEASSGVASETDFQIGPVAVAESTGTRTSESGNGLAADDEAHGRLSVLPGLKLGLKSPKDWLSRRKTDGSASEQEDQLQIPSSEAEQAPYVEDQEESDLFSTDQASGDGMQSPTGSVPILTLLPPLSSTGNDDPVPELPSFVLRAAHSLSQKSLDLPPYQVAPQEPYSPPANDDSDELVFDGWEDHPPSLATTERAPEPGPGVASTEPPGGPPEPLGPLNSRLMRSSYRTPPLFPVDVEPDTGADSHAASGDAVAAGKTHTARDLLDGGKAVAGRGLAWGVSAMRALLPDRPERQPGASRSKSAEGRWILPGRTVIAIVLVLVVGILAISVLQAGGSAKQNAANTLLQQAQQEDTLANKPGIPDSEKLAHLNAALAKTQQALVDTPQSVEAQRLVAQIEGEIDKLEGVTRLASAKLLFDLDQAENAGESTGTTQPASPAPAQLATAGRAVSAIAVQSNDAYLLDKSAGHLYRCQLSSQRCSIVLSPGDNAGGQKVGNLIAMGLRVGTLIALDDKLVAYTFNSDTSAWSAQQLGDADKLQQPKGIATYDGNLYLLGAKPGQISKYASGAYDSSPVDWIKDPGTADAIKDPAGFAIDGAIYVLLSDGRMVIMQGGKTTRLVPSRFGSGAGAFTSIYTGTDVHDLYLLHGPDGSVVRLTKDGDAVATLKPPASQPNLSSLSAMTVDEGRGKLYLVSGRRVYEAPLPGTASSTQPVPASAPADAQLLPAGNPQPTARPTASP